MVRPRYKTLRISGGTADSRVVDEVIAGLASADPAVSGDRPVAASGLGAVVDERRYRGDEDLALERLGVALGLAVLRGEDVVDAVGLPVCGKGVEDLEMSVLDQS